MISSPNQSLILTALRTFLLDVLGSGVEVIAAADNRVPEPRFGTYVVMNPIRYQRLATNVDTNEDVRFTGSIAGNLMTVSTVDFGTIRIGAVVFGTGVAAATLVDSQSSGAPGGAGVYVVSIAQTVSSRILSTGQKTMEQSTEVVVQLDFHSADNSAAMHAQTVSTLFRDELGAQLFAEQSPAIAAPLYADDPRYVPFINAEQQYEWRWMLEAHLQVHPATIAPAQYADAVAVTLVNVDATYPP